MMFHILCTLLGYTHVARVYYRDTGQVCGWCVLHSCMLQKNEKEMGGGGGDGGGDV